MASEGQVARDDALARVDANAHPRWRRCAFAAVFRRGVEGGRFTAEDCWAYIPDGVWTHEPRAMGSVIQQILRDGFIEHVGWTSANKAVSHAGPRREYVATPALYELMGVTERTPS